MVSTTIIVRICYIPNALIFYDGEMKENALRSLKLLVDEYGVRIQSLRGIMLVKGTGSEMLHQSLVFQ